MKRREFLYSTGATSLAMLSNASWAASPPARPKARVIIIGGGMAGATVAKYLRLWGDAIDVTLIERNPNYTSRIMSSLVLTGQRTLASLTFNYDKLQSQYGARVVFDNVVGMDPVAVTVTLASGKQLSADRIVMAPGIAFDPVPGLGDSDRMPHAWTAGPQTTLLARQLAAMPSNGVVVLTIPKTPYRCPPGPYERACLIADWLKASKPRAKIVVLDANPDIVAEQDNFTKDFLGLHADVIEYQRNAQIISVDPGQMRLMTNNGPIRADVVNLIPRQRAPALVADAGLATATGGRFAPVDVLSYASTVAPTIHVIGDASATTQPKAGHIANQEAKVCADALTRIFAGIQPDPSPVTNSACYSTITRREAGWLQVVFQYDATAKVMRPAKGISGASEGWSGKNFKQMTKWFDALMSDTFA